MIAAKHGWEEICRYLVAMKAAVDHVNNVRTHKCSFLLREVDNMLLLFDRKEEHL